MIVVSQEKSPSSATGYRMISNFRCRNFRAFDELSLSNLRRINVIVGASASGKTALLEGIRLALGATPQIGFSLTQSRGVPVFLAPNSTNQTFESAWSSLFFDFDARRRIWFEITDSEDRQASLTIRFDAERSSTQVVQQFPGAPPGLPVLTTTIVPVAFERQHLDGTVSTLLATLNQQGMPHFEQGRDIGPASELMLSAGQTNAIQAANWFSQMSIDNQERTVIEAIRQEFSEITDLSVESPNQFASIYATMTYRTKKMPLALVSSGLNKFVYFLVAIRNYREGVVLVDEVENGIYYKMLPALWETLRKFSATSDTQLFLSTHSWECLKAVSYEIERHPNDFNLIQVYQEDGRSHALVVPGEDAAAAIESGIEIRT